MSLAVGASIGVAVYPEHGDDMETLSQNADVAMYAAKLQHRPYAFYDPVDDRRDPPQRTLMAELHEAIAKRELELFYQPIAIARDRGGPRGRGAAALAAPDPGLDPSATRSSTRARDRGDQAADALRPRGGAAAGAGLGAGGPRAHGRREHRDAQPARRRVPGSGRRRCSSARSVRRPRSGSSSPRRRSSPTRSGRSWSSRSWPRSASACRSTTSAPATRPWPT